MERVMSNPAPDYRVHVPWHIRAVLGSGALFVVLSFYCLYEHRFLLGIVYVALAILLGLFRMMLFLVIDPKRRQLARDRMINSIKWSGTEQVLDVGCGNGLLLLAAARHLTPDKGRATGIEIWKEMAGRQSAGALRRNAEIEGVGDRIEVREADARNMPFENSTFDVIFASLSLHHAGGTHGIRQVLSEMKRVLKYGGVILIYDVYPAATVATRTLCELGVQDVDVLSGGILRVLRARLREQ